MTQHDKGDLARTPEIGTIVGVRGLSGDELSSQDKVKLYNGKFRRTTKTSGCNKVFAFDIDETLGCFSDLVALWYVFPVSARTQINFNALLDIYPEFLRYGILTILEYLYHKKKQGLCSKLYLYTNNRFSPEIPTYIAKYFDYKMGIYTDMENMTKTHLFDHVICAFKVGNRVIEPCRTSHRKLYSDFIRCTLLPRTTEICFVDDLYHPGMNHSKIYYIQPKEYKHSLDTQEFIDRACLFMPEIYKRDQLEQVYSNYQKNWVNNELNIQVSKKMMYHIKEFFYLSSIISKTRKSKPKGGRGTRRR
jgi:hypothetical protein